MIKDCFTKRVKGFIYTVSIVLCVVASVGLVTNSYAHAPLPPPPKKPPPPPPPPPPCTPKTIMVTVGTDDCTGKPIKEPRIVCSDGGSPNSVSHRTGYESFTREDIVINGVYPITMIRQYMSNSTYDSPLGYGWSFNQDVRLFQYPDNSVVVRTGCGVNYKYVYTGSAYQAEVGTDVLTNNPDGTFDLVYLGGQRDHFDTQGRLIEAWDTRGNRLEYSYTADKKPLIGSSPFGVDPSRPVTVAYVHQLTKIQEIPADGSTGNYVDLTYNATTGRLETLTSNDGRIVSYVHDITASLTKGNLVQVNALEGVVSTYVYDDKDPVTLAIRDHHNITEIKHSVDRTPIQLIYDAPPEDRVITETIGNQVFSFDWASYPLRTKVTETVTDDQGMNAVNATREYAFDAAGYLSESIDALGNKVTYVNNANGNTTKEQFYENQGTLAIPVLVLVRTVDSTFSNSGKKLTESIVLDSGETISYTWTYDGSRIATKEVVTSLAPAKVFKTENIFNHDALGKPNAMQAERRYKDNGVDYLETSYSYNSNGDLLTTTLPDGHVIENEYSATYAGRYVTKTTHKVAGFPVPDLEETYQYDTYGNRTHVTDARSYTTITAYDDLNRRETVTNAKGHVTTSVYDANGNLTQIKRDRTTAGDQLDITRLTYDGKNQLIQIERTDNTAAFITRETMRYDSTGNIIARGDAFGNETILQYDIENRLTRITDAQGNYIQYTLNALGHQTKTEYFTSTNTLVKTSTVVFDDLNQQLQIIGAINQTTTSTYDAAGNRIIAIDALSRPATVYTYDTLSRLTNIKDANGKDTVYQYDSRDQLRYVTDPRGLQTEYQYNELVQLTKLISPDTGTTEYTYDLAGNRQTQKDARNITVTFAYDELNRITSKSYPTTSLNVTYSYDTSPNGIGKLASMIDDEGSTAYEYDHFGNLSKTTRVTNGQTYVTEYAYDANDRLIKTTYPSGRTVDLVRNNLGQVTSVTTTPNGGSEQTITSSMTYLPFGVLEDMTYGNGLLLDQSYDQDYRLTDQILGTLYDRDYVYDAVNNIKDIIDNTAAAKTQNFNYDALDRLDDATSSPTYGALDYAYDDVGNRISLTLDGGIPTVYNYDSVANQLDDTTGTQTHSFVYDLNGNTITKDSLSFTYDDSNRMAQVDDGGVITSYTYNGKGERVKKAGSGTTSYHYDDVGNLLVETDIAGNTLVEYVWLGSQRLAMVDGGGTYFAQADHLGSVQLLVDSVGGVVWSGDYDPFGEVVVGVGSSVGFNLRFPGQYYDQESGLHYNYFRDYDPSIGRYVESDPIGLDGGLNTYVYTLSNPIAYIDHKGLNRGIPTIPVDPNPPPKQPKPKDCASVFRFCMGGCLPRCPGPAIVKGGVCGAACTVVFVTCVFRPDPS